MIRKNIHSQLLFELLLWYNYYLNCSIQNLHEALRASGIIVKRRMWNVFLLEIRIHN